MPHLLQNKRKMLLITGHTGQHKTDDRAASPHAKHFPAPEHVNEILFLYANLIDCYFPFGTTFCQTVKCLSRVASTMTAQFHDQLLDGRTDKLALGSFPSSNFPPRKKCWLHFNDCLAKGDKCQLHSGVLCASRQVKLPHARDGNGR